MPRQARLDAPGTLHHVIIRGIERKKIVDDNDDKENFINRMGSLARETYGYTGRSFLAQLAIIEDNGVQKLRIKDAIS